MTDKLPGQTAKLEKVDKVLPQRDGIKQEAKVLPLSHNLKEWLQHLDSICIFSTT